MTASRASVPEPGARISILFEVVNLDGEDSSGWMPAWFLAQNDGGLWWTPADDEDGAYFNPWHTILQVSFPVPPLVP